MLATLVKSDKQISKIKTFPRNAGKVAAKTSRLNNLVPCCLYGKDISNREFSISLKDASRLRNGQIVELLFDDKSYKSVIKEIQYDYLKDRILHIDFLGLVEGRFIEIEVPIEITGESQGVKKGGILQVLISSLTIKVLPDNIPEKITIDVTDLDLGDSIHVSDLVKIEHFKNIKFVNKLETAIVTVTVPQEEKTESEQQS